ncbi:MAG: ATP-binding cassette domain-containing protein [Roseburia sp.]|nr:ATP-binding cassette domain-containing protein [Roseburia sp.]MCM1278005.1 ATP-binding cassette domain-containing protein [Robinsoniella sp.]
MEIKKCLQLVNLEDCIKKKVKKLSGGMVRRLGIAQALLGNPEILIFDEPTTGLDPEERMRFKRILTQLGKEKTIIISTHIVEDIEAICDKVIIMKHGKKVLEEATKNITNHKKSYIYELNEADLNKVKSDYRILKIYNKNNLLTNRIISREKLQYEETEAVLEDIYYEYVSWEE